MGKFSGINRAYSTGEIPKTPQELQRELDEKMKKFLAKGGKIEKVKAHKPTKQQEKDWTIQVKKKLIWEKEILELQKQSTPLKKKIKKKKKEPKCTLRMEDPDEGWSGLV